MDRLQKKRGKKKLLSAKLSQRHAWLLWKGDMEGLLTENQSSLWQPLYNQESTKLIWTKVEMTDDWWSSLLNTISIAT